MTLKDWIERAKNHAIDLNSCDPLQSALDYLEGAREMNEAAEYAIFRSGTDPTGAGQNAIHELMSKGN